MTTTIATIATSSHIEQNPYGVVYVSKRTGELTIERYPNDRERDTAYAILVKTHESVSKIEPGEVWVSERQEGCGSDSVGPFPIVPPFNSPEAVEQAARTIRVMRDTEAAEVVMTKERNAMNSIDHERIKAEGFAAGLASPRGIHCPYDGRTKAGKAWWDGFMAGDAKRCTAVETDRVTCEVNFATGEYREVCDEMEQDDADLVSASTVTAAEEEDPEAPWIRRIAGLQQQRDELADALEAALQHEDASATEMEAMGYTAPELPWKEQARAALRNAGRLVP